MVFRSTSCAPASARRLSLYAVFALLLLTASLPALGQSILGGCLYSLDPSAQQAFYITGNTSVSAGCSIVVESSNGSAFVIGGTETLNLVNHAKVGVVGGWQLNGNSIVDTMSNQQEQPVTIANPGDPLASVVAPTTGTIVSATPVTYGQSNPPPNNTLSPGVYCGGLSIGNPGGVEYTMAPGTYIIAGGGFSITSSADVVGSGVTIYNTSSGGWGCSSSYSYKPISIDGQAKVNLSAPTSGALASVVLFGDRNGCATPGSCIDNINGQATATFTGNLYFPSDQLIFNGSSTTGGCMGVVADTITINGHSNFGSQACSINPIAVTVTPATTALYGGQQQSFSAAVTNTYNTTVTWSISPSVGSIDASGTYTAPTTISTEQTVTVTATSQANPNVSGSATITLFPPVTVTVSPATALLYQGQAQQFSATVGNAINTAVTWTISPVGAGTVDGNGLYTAPVISNQQTVIVTATSVVDTSKSASATITLMPPIAVSLSPGSATLYGGQAQQFTPTVINTSNTAVTWSISPAGVGSLDATGNYTAPAAISTQQSLTVTATSVADPTKSASASITLMPPIAVSVLPSTITLYGGQTEQFNASVLNTSNSAVTWSINPTGIGTISSSGLYTAPTTISSQQTVTVTATSQADPTRSAFATITLAPPACTSNGYSYVRAIVIDHTKVPNTDQVNFPFLFNTTDPSFATTANGGHVQSPNGYDISFSTDPTGQTRLDYEMEEYNPATGQVIAWIRIPSLSHTTDTVVYMFYGNSAITTSQQNPTGVWDSNYVGVWHLPNGAALSANDSTANGNNGTVAGASATSGEIDGGASFNGSTSSINFGTNITTAQMNTVSLWAYINTLNSAQELVSHSAVSQGVEVLVYNNSICAYVMGSSTSDVCSTSGAKVPGWNHIVLTQGGPNASMNLFINGAPAGSATTPSSISNPPNLDFGFWANASGRYFAGTLDEVRISSSVRSADWIATEYNDQSSPSTFYAVYPENAETVIPSSVTLYASQKQLFTAIGQCSSSVQWTMSSGALGVLSPNGLYTAPATISTEQRFTVTATDPTTSNQGTATITLLPPPTSVSLTLAAVIPPPYVVGASEQFTATLNDRDGNPLPDTTVTFAVTGANSTTGSATTDSNGVATFSYSGANAGNDTIQATTNAIGTPTNSNSVVASWIVPSQPISTTTVTGGFYFAPELPNCICDGFPNLHEIWSPDDKLAFQQAFTTVNFNPESGSVPGNTSGIYTETRPFSDVLTDASGNFSGAIAAQGNGYQAGVGPLFTFKAVFTATFEVASAGNITLDLESDDGWVLSVGNGATRVSGPMNDPPSSGTSPFLGLPVMASYNVGSGPYVNAVTINFPGPGTYPYELDYFECCGGELSMVMKTATANTPTTETLELTPTNPSSKSVGQSQTFTVVATDASGHPISGAVVGLLVTGANSSSQSATTNAAGTASFSYVGANTGTDTVQVTSMLEGMATFSNIVSVPWTKSSSTGTTGSGGNGTLSVSISAPALVTLPKTLSLTGTATDSALPAGSTITTNWSQVSGPGTVTFADPQQLNTTASFTQQGNYVLELTATDSINSGSAQLSITVNPEPGQTQGWIGSPANGATVSGVVPITVASGETLTSGTLTYYPSNNLNDVVTLNADTTGSGQIGTFDATTLPNGSYWIQLQATDTNGNQEYSLALVTVEGSFKPGRVTATVTDLVVPANGLSIQVQRTYDSLNTNTVGDFGYGWTLGTNVDLTVDPKGDVTFTLNGQRKTFYLTPQFGGWFLPYYLPVYTPEPGLHGTLTDSSSGCPDFFDFLVPDGSIWDCVGGGQFNPPGYIYTDPSGTRYLISATGALQAIADKNGNTITITANGITSSTGLNVKFARDSQGRITTITDPNQNQYSYTYDSNGNLSTVTYPGQSQPSTYTYAANHYYTGGTDANGNQLPTTSYYGPTDTDPNGLPLNGRLESVSVSPNPNTTYTTNYAYDLQTNTTTITYPPDASGSRGTETRVYDSNGDLLSDTDPLGHVTTNTYDANHNLISTVDPVNQGISGEGTTYTYDANGNRQCTSYPKTATTSSSTTSCTYYNQFSEPTSTKDELGNVRTFTYDADYNPASVTDSLGTLASFLFNSNGTLEAGAIGYDIAANQSMASQFGYDTDGNLTSRTDALGRTTSYTYNSLGQKVSMTIPVPAGASASDATTTYTYDALGNLTNTAAPLGRSTSSTYDANGNKLTDTDARGHVTHYQYDALNRLIKTTYPDQTTDTRSYDFRNNLVDEVDQEGHDTHYTYDLAGRLASITKAFGTPDAGATTYTYDADGRKLTETDAASHITTYTYDAAGNLTGISGPGGTFTYGYDDAHNRTSVTDGNGNTTNYEYDARKRLVKTTYPDAGKTTTTYGYDGPGNLTSVTDQAGNRVQYTYDAANQLKSVVQVNSPNTSNNTTGYGYDPDGNLITLTDANGHATSNSYDLLNELTTKTLPDGAHTEKRTYDFAGNLQTLQHFNGYTTSYAYDSLNRLSSRTPDPATGEPVVSFTYTNTGKRASMTDASGTTNYTYDNLDRLITKQTPEGTLNYTYDAAGNLASMTSGDGNVSVNYTWDSLNRLSTVTDNRLTGTSNTTTYTYDTANNVVKVAYPNGVQATLNYDPLNRLTSLTTPQTGYLYQLGPTGNRTNVTELTGRSINWSYDGIYRLTGETIGNAPSKVNGSVAYGLDPVGNRISTNSTIAGINSGALSFNPDDQELIESYDADGNTTATGGKSFAYDSEDRLKSMNGGAVTITYDGDGNRVQKIANGVITRYLVDDLNPTGYPQVVEETGSAPRTYTYGLQRIDEDQVINGVQTPSFYGYDGMGSVRQLTNSSGAITDTYEYDAFGNKIASTGTTLNNYLYRGEQWDPDLSLYYLRARYYNPLTGRFMSRDPNTGNQLNPMSLHKYLYAGGDPINFVDPAGRDSLLETGSLDAIIGTRPLPALTELAGGAYASAASWAVGRYLAAAELAETAQAAVSDYIEAVDWAELAKGITKVFLCESLEIGLEHIIDTYAGSGVSDILIPEIAKEKFQEACWEYAGQIPPLK